jgi:hypothetical protein
LVSTSVAWVCAGSPIKLGESFSRANLTERGRHLASEGSRASRGLITLHWCSKKAACFSLAFARY